MILYRHGNLVIETIKNKDVLDVINLFNSTNFNCDSESGSLRPTDWQFMQIIEDIIKGDRLNQVLVLKKNDKVIGYLSCYVEYEILHLGHIVILETERYQGYGKLLTEIAVQLASNDNRRISLTCFYPDVRFLKELGFKKMGTSYVFKGNVKNPKLPSLFMSVNEYREMADEKMKKEMDNWNYFLESDIMEMIREENVKIK